MARAGILVGMTLFVSCTGTRDAAPEGPLVVGELVRDRIAGLEVLPGPLLSRPWMMLAWRDSLVILDNGEKEVAILPRSLEGGRSFGRPGKGPGEFRSPTWATPQGNDLLVWDRGNARVTRFDPDGQILDETTLTLASLSGAFLPAEGEGLFLPSAGDTHYLELAVDGDPPALLLPRPPGMESPHQDFVTSNIVYRFGDALALVDMENGAVCLQLPDGESRLLLPPESVRDEMQRRYDVVKEGDTRNERRVPKILKASASDEGILLWLIGKDDPVGLLLTPEEEWVEIVGVSQREDFPEYPSDVLLLDGELYVLSVEGVRTYTLTRGDFPTSTGSSRLVAQRSQVYGSVDGEGALSSVFDVAVSPRGRVYASQPTYAEVYVYEADGRFQSVLGGRGEGPGEFKTPGAIRFRGDSVTVLDFMSGINLFSPDGDFMEQISFTLPTPAELGFPTKPALLLADGTVACTAPVRSFLIITGTTIEQSWVRATREGELLDTLVVTSVENSYTTIEVPGRPPTVLAQPVPWIDLILVAPDGTDLFIVDRSAALEGVETLLRVYKTDLQGDTILAIEIPYDPFPLTPEWRDSVSLSVATPGAALRELTPDRYAELIRDQVTWPVHHPSVTHGILGPDGSLWLKREMPVGDSIRWDILDSELEPVGHTFLPARFEAKWVSRSSVWGVELDEVDIPFIIRFDLREP